MSSTTTKEESIFGTADGLSSTLGVVIAVAITHPSLVATAAVAVAVGSAVSMCLSEYLSDSSESNYKAFIMGIATFIGAISPAIPFFIFSGTLAYILCGIICSTLCIIISRNRPGGELKSLIITFSVTLISSGLAVGASLLAGAA